MKVKLTHLPVYLGMIIFIISVILAASTIGKRDQVTQSETRAAGISPTITNIKLR